MSIHRLFLVLFVGSFLAACSNNDNDEVNGRLVDAGVAGVAYSTGGITGITAGDGGFSCNEDSEISFSLGGLLLGSSSCQPLITPLDLLAGNIDDSAVINLARLLQSLDSDGDTANGISITDAAAAAAPSAVNFADTAAFESDVAAYVSAHGGTGALISSEAAQQHLACSLVAEGSSDASVIAACEGAGGGNDADDDGVDDSIDECPDTPADTAVDAKGCPVSGGTDSDGDGVDDSIDECPDTPTGTAVDAKGCPVTGGTDSDGDSVDDSIDECPDTPTGTTVDAKGCPVTGSTDSDGDGVDDSIDECPDTPAGTAVDAKGCPLTGGTDSDGDGVDDSIDECPATPADTVVDAKGCPVGGGDAALTRYNVANSCVMFKAGEQYISRNGDGYGMNADVAEATAFYMKPTRLGAYLLLSDYQRDTGQIGSKQLLGITDPLGELLDDLGEFVGEVSFVLSGLGDMSEYFTDPVFLPALGAAGASDAPRVRDPGEAVNTVGETLGDQNASPSLGLVTEASDLAVWVLDAGTEDRFTLASDVTGQYLVAGDGLLGLSAPGEAGASSEFEMLQATGCASYPEAEINAVVAEEGPATYLHEVPMFAERGVDEDDIFGFVDTHAHISAYEFIGGRINYGDPFHKFGVDHALENCDVNHGPQGMTGFVEHVTSTLGPHETQGWPSYNFWPVNNSLQHHQSYYKWIERAFLAGQKIMVNHLVHNEILCQLNPQKQNDCDAMPAIELQAEVMHDMQDYIDAQEGGPGAGWFRIVTSPAQAREVIADGKMAVILGVEMSKVLNCGEFLDVPECTVDEINQRLDRLYDMDVRSLFPVHKFDNAFGGHLPDLGNPVGIAGVLYAGNLGETGHPIEYETCPEEEYTGTEPNQGRPNYVEAPDPANIQEFGIIEQLLFQLDYLGKIFPAAPEEFAEYDPRGDTDEHCNSRGLTSLGEYLVNELMRRKMFIETDHISRKAAARILEMTGEYGYPIVNSHGGWGGTHAIRDRITQQGGLANEFAGTRSGFIGRVLQNGDRPRPAANLVAGFGGSGFASDVNGIASLPGNPGEADEGLYPFTSVDGRVTFDIQKTGDRSFGLYDGRGVAHYGLYPDLIADAIRNGSQPPADIERAIGHFFTSAEAYLRMWERMEAAPLPAE